MNMFANKKFISIVMVAVLLVAGFINRNYKNSDNSQTAKILGEAAYVNNNVKIEESDELKQVKNLREKSKDQTYEMLQELIDNPNTTAVGRKNAEQALIELAKSIKNEADCETILRQKGFEDVVVTITENTANVSIGMKDLMNTEIAQITETVASVTGFETEKIKILSGD